ncbi:unnamed protein product [Effrenium voratum]|uniref:peptidylprolyl isomerase n=1 Tax=Effrenium voratum TaxID=2562239 RepID=A0AA36HKZ7_9DINO|nr:unnamed protein product [Effrenium voratum]CAJ1371111.1 unnamed protein product [Effrenium voratum]CAJ1414658.1 unnamed protein product [Effrenium voratum]
MWHGCVEAPSSSHTLRAVEGSAGRLFEDELERLRAGTRNSKHHADSEGSLLAPLELRRNDPNVRIGQPPPDRLIREVKQKEKDIALVDISASQDGSLRKQILVPAAVDAPSVYHGATVRAQITAACKNSRSPESCLLHGPKEHIWSAACGARCQLVELTISSMKQLCATSCSAITYLFLSTPPQSHPIWSRGPRLGESCVASSGNAELYVDRALGIAGAHEEVEYSVVLKDISPPWPADCRPSALLLWADEQKQIATQMLQQDQVHLALLKFLMLHEMTNRTDTGQPNSHTELKALSRACRLNAAVCLGRLSQWRRVCEICSDVLAEDPCNQKALYRRGQASLRMGLAPAAQEDFAKALQVDPDSKEIQRQVSYCEKLLTLPIDKTKRGERSKVDNKWA